MGEANLALTPDGGVLHTLPTGLQIVRRKKHEWLNKLAKADAAKLNSLTNKTWGSKFLPTWDLVRVTLWIENEVTAAEWTLDVQEPCPLTVRLNEEVGLVEGIRVHTIRVVCDGRHIHAYPVRD